MAEKEITVKYSKAEAIKLEHHGDRLFPEELPDDTPRDVKLLYSAFKKVRAARFAGERERT